MVVVVGGGRAAARHAAPALATPLDGLRARAERLGAGDARQPALKSGIVEIDQLSEALFRGTMQASRRLAAERVFGPDASHQLRSPLTALRLRLENLSAELGEGTQGAEVEAATVAVPAGDVTRSR